MFIRLFIRAGAVGLLLYVLVQGTNIGKEQFLYWKGFGLRVITRQEISVIARKIHADFVSETGRLPGKSTEEWNRYIRENVTSHTAIGRDRSCDLWGTSYSIEDVFAQIGFLKGGFEVRSAGPDTLFNTDDDVVVTYPYP